MKTPGKAVILIDDREKYPVLFPENLRYYEAGGRPKLISIATRRSRMTEGDYALEADPFGCVIERKGSVRELAGNFLTADRGRALKAFHRLAAHTRTPILLLDFSISDFYREAQGQPPAGHVASEILRLATSLGLTVISAGPCRGSNIRRNLGAFLAHYMIEDMIHVDKPHPATQLHPPSDKSASHPTKRSHPATSKGRKPPK